MVDLARASFIIREPAQAEHIIAAVRQQMGVFDKGWAEQPTGYLDRKLLVRMENGGTAEIQIIPERVYAFKEEGGGHRLYTIERSAPGTPEGLAADGDGEVPGALTHPATGAIDVMWGDPQAGYGLGKLIERGRLDVVNNLPEILRDMQVVQDGQNRIRLRGRGYMAVVRKDFEGHDKTWLLTAFLEDKAPATAEHGQATADSRAGSPGNGDTTNISVGAPEINAAVQTQADHLLHDMRADIARHAASQPTAADRAATATDVAPWFAARALFTNAVAAVKQVGQKR